MSIVSVPYDKARYGQHSIQIIMNRDPCTDARRALTTAVHVHRRIGRELVEVVVVVDHGMVADADAESWKRKDVPRGAL